MTWICSLVLSLLKRSEEEGETGQDAGEDVTDAGKSIFLRNNQSLRISRSVFDSDAEETDSLIGVRACEHTHAHVPAALSPRPPITSDMIC